MRGRSDWRRAAGWKRCELGAMVEQRWKETYPVRAVAGDEAQDLDDDVWPAADVGSVVVEDGDALASEGLCMFEGVCRCCRSPAQQKESKNVYFEGSY